MSSVTVFCRDGACNVASHTRTNCHNRAAAVHPARHLGTPAEIAAFLRDADLEPATDQHPEPTSRQRAWGQPGAYVEGS
jgi:hypothetical protein